MNITHVNKNIQQKWIFEPQTATDHIEIEKFVSKLKERVGVDIKKFNEPSFQEPLDDNR